jgi:Domain of unknown function (DUF4129)
VTEGKPSGTALRTSPPTQGPAHRRILTQDANFYRVALLVLLTLLAVVGLHATTSQPAWGSHTKLHDAEVAGGLEALAIVLLLVLAVRNRRASNGPPLVVRLRTALMYVLGAGIVALTITLLDLLVNLHLPSETGQAEKGVPALHPVRLRAPKSSAPASSSFPISEVLYAIFAALLLAAIVALAVKAVRSRRHQQLPDFQLPAEEYGSTLEEAILGGQRALLELDDARAAIIACYMAMEESLAQAGTARSVAETPDELLAKAAKQLLISPGPASQLTSLFYEARFSSHPLDTSHREAAERSLAELASELGSRRMATAEAGAGL